MTSGKNRHWPLIRDGCSNNRPNEVAVQRANRDQLRQALSEFQQIPQRLRYQIAVQETRIARLQQLQQQSRIQLGLWEQPISVSPPAVAESNGDLSGDAQPASMVAVEGHAAAVTAFNNDVGEKLSELIATSDVALEAAANERARLAGDLAFFESAYPQTVETERTVVRSLE